MASQPVGPRVNGYTVLQGNQNAPRPEQKDGPRPEQKEDHDDRHELTQRAFLNGWELAQALFQGRMNVLVTQYNQLQANLQAIHNQQREDCCKDYCAGVVTGCCCAACTIIHCVGI